LALPLQAAQPTKERQFQRRDLHRLALVSLLFLLSLIHS
jgi:hypothetical protein